MLYPSVRIDSWDPREWDLLPGGPHNVRAKIAQPALFAMLANVTTAGDTNSSHAQFQLPLSEMNIFPCVIGWATNNPLWIDPADDYFWQTWRKTTRCDYASVLFDITNFFEEYSGIFKFLGITLALFSLLYLFYAYVSADWRTTMIIFLCLIIKCLGIFFKKTISGRAENYHFTSQAGDQPRKGIFRGVLVLLQGNVQRHHALSQSYTVQQRCIWPQKAEDTMDSIRLQATVFHAIWSTSIIINPSSTTHGTTTITSCSPQPLSHP